MLHQNALQAARITELEEQLAVVTKRKARKRTHLQHGGTLEYGTAAAQVAAEASVAPQRSKKARGGGGVYETAQPALRRCGNCGATGHNARTCRKDTEISSESIQKPVSRLIWDSQQMLNVSGFGRRITCIHANFMIIVGTPAAVIGRSLLTRLHITRFGKIGRE
jgi:hypothetical protein